MAASGIFWREPGNSYRVTEPSPPPFYRQAIPTGLAGKQMIAQSINSSLVECRY